MHTDIVLRTQEAIDAVANGIVQAYEILAIYGEEVYNAIAGLL